MVTTVRKRIYMVVDVDGWRGGDVVVVTCASANVPIALTRHQCGLFRTNGEPFYCSIGHKHSWSVSENDRLKQRLTEAQEVANAATERQRQAEQRALDATARARTAETALGRATKRVHAGVCIHCHRSFLNVQRHMATKHAT